MRKQILVSSCDLLSTIDDELTNWQGTIYLGCNNDTAKLAEADNLSSKIFEVIEKVRTVRNEIIESIPEDELPL